MSFLRYDVDVSLSQPLQVISDPDGVLGQHVGNGVWTSAQELAIFIGSRLSLMRDQSVLELGAGLGLVGQAMAVSGARVVVSDVQELMQLLCMNIEANKQALQGSITHCVLPWGKSLSSHTYGPNNLHPDYIVGSDITYDEDCYLALLQTIAAYAWGNPHLRVILAMPDRQESASFLEVARAHGLIWRLLRHVQKPDLLTPVSIYQFIFRPGLSRELTQLVCKGDSSPRQTSDHGHRNTAVSSLPLTQTAVHQLTHTAGACSLRLGTAISPAAGSWEPKPVPESTQSLPTVRPAKQANTPSPPQYAPPALLTASLQPSPKTVSSSDDPQPLNRVNVSTSEADVCSDSAPAAAVPPPAALSSQPQNTKGKAAVPGTLLVLDFDWSMIEENSDTFVVRELGAWEAFQRLRAGKLPWTELMDSTMLAACEEHEATAADVQAACAKVPMHPRMKEVLKHASASSAVHMVILSDANTVFIDNLLEAQGLQECFDGVITNPAEFRSGALRVGPYHTAPHGCASCPPNLCKGLVLEDLLLQRNYQQVVYLGDGRGDHCPCTRLGPNDSILARCNYPDGTPCALLQLLADQGAALQEYPQGLSTVGPGQEPTPSNDSLPCLLPVGAVQTAIPVKDAQQQFLTVAEDQQDSAAVTKCREKQLLPTGTAEQDAFDTQSGAKRHKGQGIEQTWGKGSCSQPLQQHKSKLEEPDAADIDSEKCQVITDASVTQNVVCPDDLPLPPWILNEEPEQHDSMQECAGTAIADYHISGVSDSRVHLGGQCRICASVYTWKSASEAARILHALVNNSVQIA